jgi:hypothetical protein
MITLTLGQAKSILHYTGALLFIPLVLVGWFGDNKFIVSTAFLIFGIVLMWRDKFAHRVISSEIHAGYEDEDGPTHTASSAISDTTVGFYRE